MDVLVLPLLVPLALEYALLLYILFILVTRGTLKGRDWLLIVTAVISFFAFLQICHALYITMLIPIPPPPEIWDEEYYESLTMRSALELKALAESVFLLILSISYTFGRSRERQM